MVKYTHTVCLFEYVDHFVGMALKELRFVWTVFINDKCVTINVKQIQMQL